MKQIPYFIIFSGYNIRAIVSFCRFLHAYNYKFAIIASDKYDPIFHTKYKINVEETRNQKKPCAKEFILLINRIKKKHNINEVIIAPTSEYLNQFLLSNFRIFKSHRCTIPLASVDIYNKVSNKQSFLDLCKTFKINIPTRYSHLPKNFPFVAKPIRNINANIKSLYPYIINNIKDLTSFKKKENLSDFFFEEYIEGKSFYLLFYISSKGYAECFSQNNLIQQDKGKSIIFAATASIHKNSIRDLFINLFKKIKFYGLVMVELRYSNNNYYAIEANPRFWGPSQLFIDKKWPIFELFIRDITGNKTYGTNHLYSNNNYYLWLNGFIDCLINARKPVYFGNKKEILLNLIINLMRDVYLKHDTIWLFCHELMYLLKNRILHGYR